MKKKEFLASNFKRVLSFFIDISISTIIISIFYGFNYNSDSFAALVGSVFGFLITGPAFEIFNIYSNGASSLNDTLFILIFYFFYSTTSELIFNKTLGKKIFNLGLVNQKFEEKLPLINKLFRGVLKMIPFNSLSILANKRGFNDDICKIYVVDLKKIELYKSGNIKND